ncbi:hypothetical protein AAG906_038837 [Vitis piasezkii]
MLCFSLLQSHLGSGLGRTSRMIFYLTVKKLPNETVTAFISRCRAKVVKMIKRPKKRD